MMPLPRYVSIERQAAPDTYGIPSDTVTLGTSSPVGGLRQSNPCVTKKCYIPLSLRL